MCLRRFSVVSSGGARETSSSIVEVLRGEPVGGLGRCLGDALKYSGIRTTEGDLKTSDNSGIKLAHCVLGLFHLLIACDGGKIVLVV